MRLEAPPTKETRNISSENLSDGICDIFCYSEQGIFGTIPLDVFSENLVLEVFVGSVETFRVFFKPFEASKISVLPELWGVSESAMGDL